MLLINHYYKTCIFVVVLKWRSKALLGSLFYRLSLSLEIKNFKHKIAARCWNLWFISCYDKSFARKGTFWISESSQKKLQIVPYVLGFAQSSNVKHFSSLRVLQDRKLALHCDLVLETNLFAIKDTAYLWHTFHFVEGPDDFYHFWQLDCPTTVLIVHFESPPESKRAIKMYVF